MPANDRHGELLERLFHSLDRKSEENHRELTARLDDRCDGICTKLNDLRDEVQSELKGLSSRIDTIHAKQSDQEHTLSIVKKIGGASGAGILAWVIAQFTGVLSQITGTPPTGH